MSTPTNRLLRLSTVKHSDVVLVMKGGRIVEQGSPTELLEANGRFAKLWRSQFMVDSAGTVDQVAEQTQADLSQHGKPTLNRHISEGSASSFRPNAPEFVPQYRHCTGDRSGQISPSHRGAIHQHHALDTKSDAHSHSTRSDRGMSKRRQFQRNKKEIKPTDESEATSEAVTAASHPATSDSQYDGPAGETSTDSRLPQILNRWQRRRLARSEPQGSNTDSSQVDGTSEHPNANEGGAKAASRRVSGPANFPSGATVSKSFGVDSRSLKGQSQNLRRKRQRQLRMNEREKSESGLGGVACETSSALPCDKIASPQPTTPILIQKDKNSHIKSEGANDAANISGHSGPSNVRFAPEA